MNSMDSGETSRKKTKSNDGEIDRPLKKAKYLWQVKGKYHLKDNQATSPTASKNENKIIEIETKKSLAIGAKNKNVCNDRSCIEAILANSDKYMEFSLIDSPPARKNIDKSISDEIPITLVKQNPKTDDYYLRKWQARQIAKGFLDNTINRVLEHWMVASFDAADFVENCDNGGQIEDEGILMAIQSHGLQSGITARPSLFHCNARSNWEAQANCTCSPKRMEVSATAPSSSPVNRETPLTPLMPLMPFHQRAAEQQHLNDFHLEDDDKSLPEMQQQQQQQQQKEAEDPLKMNDTDFLDAAVAVAIQKKGLACFNCVDCG